MSDEKGVSRVTNELGLRLRSLRWAAGFALDRQPRREYDCGRDPKVLAKIREDVFDVGAPSDGGSW